MQKGPHAVGILGIGPEAPLASCARTVVRDVLDCGAVAQVVLTRCALAIDGRETSQRFGSASLMSAKAESGSRRMARSPMETMPTGLP